MQASLAPFVARHFTSTVPYDQSKSINNKAQLLFEFCTVPSRFSVLLSIHLRPLFLRAMKTSIDSLKLAVSWKGSQIPGAKFTVKVCVCQ